MTDRAVLSVDVGGTHVKVLVPAAAEKREFDSGRKLTPEQMVAGVLELVGDWEWEVASIGVPTVVRGGNVVAEPVNLGTGWVGFDFAAALGKPTKVVNDAAMQAIGSYEGGKMLFLGLGTGLGSALVDDGRVEPLELGHLPFRKKTFEDYVGKRGREKHGKKQWRKDVLAVVDQLSRALQPDYVVLGGGEAEELKELPPNARLGDNENAFAGGFRLWQEDWRV